jgi:hypothetical protein
MSETRPYTPTPHPSATFLLLISPIALVHYTTNSRSTTVQNAYFTSFAYFHAKIGGFSAINFLQNPKICKKPPDKENIAPKKRCYRPAGTDQTPALSVDRPGRGHGATFELADPDPG